MNKLLYSLCVGITTFSLFTPVAQAAYDITDWGNWHAITETSGVKAAEEAVRITPPGSAVTLPLFSGPTSNAPEVGIVEMSDTYYVGRRHESGYILLYNHKWEKLGWINGSSSHVKYISHSEVKENESLWDSTAPLETHDFESTFELETELVPINTDSLKGKSEG